MIIENDLIILEDKDISSNIKDIKDIRFKHFDMLDLSKIDINNRTVVYFGSNGEFKVMFNYGKTDLDEIYIKTKSVIRNYKLNKIKYVKN